MAQKSETPKLAERARSPDLRSYGRRHGRKLSMRQEQLWEAVLPRVAIDLAKPFEPGAREVWLEVGFGGGEHLVWQAERNPDVLLIGAEPFRDGVIKVLDRIEAQGLGNIRLYADDVRALLRWLPEGSLARVFILFPDPWPKKRHVKRRLVAGPLLSLLCRAMAPCASQPISATMPAPCCLLCVSILGLLGRCPAPPIGAGAAPTGWRRGMKGRRLPRGAAVTFSVFARCAPEKPQFACAARHDPVIEKCS